MKHLRLAGMLGVVVVALVAGSCVETKTTGVASPSELAAVLTAGNWSSSAMTAATSLNVGSCGNLEWKITTLTATAASGTFKATCGGGLTLEGSAEGKLNGLAADLSASGTVGGTGTACAFSLTGTAVPASLDSIRITYSGTTCLGPVSGSEVIKKH
jgi:hypothetical protein